LSLADDLVKVWDDNISAGQLNGLNADAIMSFNEPDICGGGATCMSVEDAIAGYQAYIQPYGGAYNLVSPAVTNGPNGLPWLQRFMDECDCQVDYVALHWYSEWTEGVFDYFTTYFTNAYNTFQVILLPDRFPIRLFSVLICFTFAETDMDHRVCTHIRHRCSTTRFPATSHEIPR
jgi:hypothetical protein